MDYLPIPHAAPTEWTRTPRGAKNHVAYAAPLPARTLAPLKASARLIFSDGWRVCGWVNAAVLAVAVVAVLAGAI